MARLPGRVDLNLDFAGTWIAAVVYAALIAVLPMFGHTVAAVAMIAVVIAFGAYCIRALGARTGLVVLLLVSALVDHFTFPLGPVDVRPEEIAALLALGVFAVPRLRAGDWSWLRPSRAEVLLGAWLVVGAVSSLLGSPDRRLSAKYLILYGLCILGFLLPRRVLRGPGAKDRLENVIPWLLIFLATEATYGSFGYLLHAFGPTIAISPNPASGHLESYGTLWEPNVFGSMCAAGAVAWVYFGPQRFRNSWIGLAPSMSGLVESLTRAAWGAAGVVGLLGVGLPSLRRRLDLVMVGWGLLAGMISAGAVLLVDAIGNYTVSVQHPIGVAPPQHRAGFIGSILNMTDFVGRLNQVGDVWGDIKSDVLLGRGFGSFLPLHPTPGFATVLPQHVASLPLLVLNDTGFLGLALFVAFVVTVVARAWSRRHDGHVVGLSQVALVLLVANLATQTTELMIGWLMIGMLVAASDFAPAASAASKEPRARAA